MYCCVPSLLFVTCSAVSFCTAVFLTEGIWEFSFVPAHWIFGQSRCRGMHTPEPSAGSVKMQSAELAPWDTVPGWSLYQLQADLICAGSWCLVDPDGSRAGPHFVPCPPGFLLGLESLRLCPSPTRRTARKCPQDKVLSTPSTLDSPSCRPATVLPVSAGEGD